MKSIIIIEVVFGDETFCFLLAACLCFIDILIVLKEDLKIFFFTYVLKEERFNLETNLKWSKLRLNRENNPKLP